MIEIGPEHNIDYRKEILQPLFDKIKSAESSAVIGAASAGKTRLLDFLMREDIRQHYLQEASGGILFLRVDCNRMHEMNDWGFFELLLSVLSLACSQNMKATLLRPQVLSLHAQVITERSGLMGLRYFELAVHMLCADNGLNLCILLDEFDEPYRDLPKNTLANLRAIRDANKNRLSYHLFLRNLPERLRPPKDCEGFYELFSRSALGLGPYNRDDSLVIIQQWEARRRYSLTPEQKEWILAAGRGHPGLMQALFGVLQDRGYAGCPDLDALVFQETNVIEECRKIWEGLLPEEQCCVVDLYTGKPADPEILRLLSVRRLINQEQGK
ncbi:MAG TPA: hypothetical protein VLS48_06060, partial [Anaerolineales bacterium]|nr:hypothetical protein [Anaerolineales bacterium]